MPTEVAEKQCIFVVQWRIWRTYCNKRQANYYSFSPQFLNHFISNLEEEPTAKLTEIQADLLPVQHGLHLCGERDPNLHAVLLNLHSHSIMDPYRAIIIIIDEFNVSTMIKILPFIINTWYQNECSM